MIEPDDEMKEKARYIKGDLLEVKDLLCNIVNPIYIEEI